jgi:hypothetical protein
VGRDARPALTVAADHELRSVLLVVELHRRPGLRLDVLDGPGRRGVEKADVQVVGIGKHGQHPGMADV